MGRSPEYHRWSFSEKAYGITRFLTSPPGKNPRYYTRPRRRNQGEAPVVAAGHSSVITRPLCKCVVFSLRQVTFSFCLRRVTFCQCSREFPKNATLRLQDFLFSVQELLPKSRQNRESAFSYSRCRFIGWLKKLAALPWGGGSPQPVCALAWQWRNKKAADTTVSIRRRLVVGIRIPKPVDAHAPFA